MADTTLSIKDYAGATKALGVVADASNSNALIGTTRIADVAGTNKSTVKAASTAPLATDTSLVVALNPNAASISDGTTVCTLKAASTAAAAGDTSLVVALNPKSPSITDGTNTASVKAASTAPATTDKALVVALCPNNVSFKDASTAAEAADLAMVVAVSPNNTVNCSTECARATYAGGAMACALAATPTDIIELQGSATKIVKLKKITLSGYGTTAGSLPMALIKRSAITTDGTPVEVTAKAKFDTTNDASATAKLQYFSANPTPKTGLGQLRVGRLSLPLVTTAGASNNLVFSFSDANDKAPMLKDNTEAFVINCNSQALNGGERVDFSVEWEEV